MAIKRSDKYADYRYEIESETELAEAKWQIELGLYKDLEDYINCYTRSEKRIMKRLDAEQQKRLAARKSAKIVASKNQKAA